jgi:two-component system, NarL family, sensor histidine kinase UhpB
MTMKPTVGEDAGRKISARRDIALIVAIAIAAFYLSAKYNVSESLLAWSRPLERLQVDELPGVLLVVAICLVWFSSRRFFEANHELLLRRSVEARLGLDAVSIRETGESCCGARDAAGAMIANIDRVYGVVGGLIRQLRPVAFDDLGLAAALEYCVGEWRSRLPRVSIEMSIETDLESLDETRRLVIYRLVQEALTNIARHSQATQAEIRIASAGTPALGPCVDILIADNGCGADMHAPSAGLGLIGMRERVSALGGSIAIESERGAGFKIMSSLPVSGGQS